MSTSKPGNISPLAEEALAGAVLPTGLGLPDTETLAQWANALFSALPGRPTVPGTAADAQAAPPGSALAVAPPTAPEGEFESLPAAPFVPPTSGFSPPGETEPRALPNSLASAGALPPPSTAAAPPESTPRSALDPAQGGMPGVALGLGPAQAGRLEAGGVPTTPSPPAAVAQPGEPNPRSTPLGAGDAAGLAPSAAGSLPAPFAFRPELVPAPGDPAGSLATEPTPQPPATAALAVPSGPVAQNADAPYYFLDGESWPDSEAGLAQFDPFGFPGGGPALGAEALALDSRGPLPGGVGLGASS